MRQRKNEQERESNSIVVPLTALETRLQTLDVEG